MLSECIEKQDQALTKGFSIMKPVVLKFINRIHLKNPVVLIN